MVIQNICLLIVVLSGINGKVVNDETLVDILTNVISEDNGVKNVLPETRITLPNVIEKVITTNSQNSSDDDTCITDDISENEIDSDDKKQCKPKTKTDNGKALILTPYIEEGRIKEARNASKVDPDLFLGVKSYSGFVTIDKRYNSNTFFWYFPRPKPANDTPWILWLQGGPGASSMTGLFDEIGPFRVFSGVLRRNHLTWLKNHSLVFFENPVGTGFSFTEHEDGFATDLPTYGRHLYLALKQFLQLFPELQTVPLFLAGESYAGKYVPALAMEIHNNKDSPDGNINLKGLILGNAYTGPEMLAHLELPYYYFGLLDMQQITQLQPLIDSFREDVAANKSVSAKRKWMSLVTLILSLTNQKHAYNFLRDELAVGRYVQFLRRSDVRRAIHVGDINYDYLNVTANFKLEPEFLTSTKNIMEQLLDHYKVLSYCGQLDQMIPCVASTENYRRWRWTGSEAFIKSIRQPYLYRNQLAGYCKTGGNLTEVVLRGAGHMVPIDAPAPLLTLVSRWTHGQPLALKELNESLFNILVRTPMNATIVNFF